MKTIKIPKVSDFTPVCFYKGKSSRKQLVLRRQVIQGVEIPKDSTIDIDWAGYKTNHAGDMLHVPAQYVNRLLRFIYLENIRKTVTKKTT